MQRKVDNAFISCYWVKLHPLHLHRYVRTLTPVKQEILSKTGNSIVSINKDTCDDFHQTDSYSKCELFVINADCPHKH